MAIKKRSQDNREQVRDLKLMVLGHGRGGRLDLVLGEKGKTISIPMEGRHIRFLKILQRARESDQDVPEADRGWISLKQVSEAWAEDDTDYAPPARVMSSYKWAIRRRVRDAAAGLAGPPPELFSEKPKQGFRLAHSISEIVDLARRRGRPVTSAPTSG